MKNLTKLFMAVVAGMLTFSCVTDTTEDLGVSLGEGQTTTISIALDDEARTYIGETDGNSYPMYWSVGDQISVNGTASKELTATDINGNTATFVIPAVIEGNYCVAYPAANAGQVKFAAEQTHKDNSTFGDGVTTMYGYGAQGNLTLKSLTGILKVGVALPEGAEATTLKKAQISTADRQPIAGDFAIDFESGEITATESSTDVISYSFGEGVALSSEATWLHIAVPAGIYDELYITLYTNKGVMKATVRATESKPLTEGKIRVFPEIEFKANADVYLIDSEEALFDFAAAVKAGAVAGTPFAKDALLVEDIELTKPWETLDWDTTITTVTGEGESAVTTSAIAPVSFNGNGYAIKGLNAPLFGTTTASFKGLHLRDVNIEMTNPNYVGALARNINNVAATVEYCSATGKITLNGLTADKRACVGGLIGTSTADQASNAKLSNLHNEIDITINGKITTTSDIVIGGCVGFIHQCYVDNSSNLGKINITTTEASKTMRVGGIAGDVYGVRKSVNGAKGTTLGAISISGSRQSSCSAGVVSLVIYGGVSDCVNYAPVTQTNGDSDVYMSGIVHRANSTMTVENCTNYGTISHSGTVAATIMAGVCAEIYNTTTISNCHNHGNLNAAPTDINGSYNKTLVGGLVGQHPRGVLLTLCGSEGNEATNTGNITVKGTPGNPIIGGIIGLIKSAEKNGSDANISYVKNSGKIVLDSEKTTANTYVGGIVGLDDRYGADAPDFNIVNISDAINSGSITVGGSATSEGYQIVSIGGIVGRDLNSTITIKNVKNTKEATLEFKGKAANDLTMGGLYGAPVSTKLNTCTGELRNEATVKYSGTGVAGRTCMGGFWGLSDITLDTNNCTLINTGDIICAGEVAVDDNIMNGVGGLIGVETINGGGVNNGRSWCYVEAPEGVPAGAIAGRDNYNKNGANRNIYAKNCHCGGSISRDGGVTVTDITKDNYCEFVYNKAHSPEDIVLVRGCGYISSIDAEPQFAKAEIKENDEIGVIDSYDKLQSFAEAVNAGTYTKKMVYFTSDIDMTGKEWTPINGFNGSIFGQGKKIKNLTAPLFGKTQVMLVDDLHLENVNIVGDASTSRLGAFICEKEGNAALTLSNCSVSGNISTCYTGGANLILGGIIGFGEGNANNYFYNLTSSVHITSTSKSAKYTGNFGGVVSLVHGRIEECQFAGSITLPDGVSHKEVNVGGVLNRISGDIINCENGIQGDTEAGKLDIQATASTYIFVGGIISGNSASTYVKNEGLKGCKNYAPINVGGNLTGSYAFVGGMMGLMHRVKAPVVDCTNYGAITISINSTSESTTACQFAGIGCLNAGNCVTKVDNCANYGTITVAETASFKKPFYVGGIVSQTQSGATYTNLTNNGDIYIDGNTVDRGNSYIGGIAGQALAEISNSTAACNIAAVDYTNVGMITGSARVATAPTVKNCSVGGNYSTEKVVENIEWWYVFSSLTAENYVNYIYGKKPGDNTDWAGTTDHDGCTLDYTVVEVPEGSEIKR